jgi:uncharacterized repeat protein (TIGR03803 family)
MTEFAKLICVMAVTISPCCGWAASSTIPERPGHAGSFAVIHTFDDNKGKDGAVPNGGVLRGPDGAFYGVTSSGGPIDSSNGTLYRVDSSGKETVLHVFDVDVEGGGPVGPPVLSADGRLHGVTNYGGALGYGTVYDIDLDGSGLQVSYLFFQGGDSLYEPGQLAQAEDGTLYGIAIQGGQGNGGVFAISPDGAYSVLHEFAADGSEGWLPLSIVTGADGTVWGTMDEGGTANGGVAWHLSGDGTFHVVRNFTNTIGREPSLWLAFPDGSFYGTTLSGGPNGNGTIFSMTRGGKIQTIYGFGGRPFEGNTPAGLLRSSDGTLYGVAQSGGKDGGKGTVYRLRNGRLTILHAFGAVFANGTFPTVGLAMDDDGYLYGACSNGGKANRQDIDGMGTVFKLAR